MSRALIVALVRERLDWRAANRTYCALIRLCRVSSVFCNSLFLWSG
jgi:hypothetical protein